METWNDVPVVDVDKLPAQIDGSCIYRLGGSPSHGKGISWKVIPKDGRKWRKARTANAKGMAKGRCNIYSAARGHTCVRARTVCSWRT